MSRTIPKWRYGTTSRVPHIYFNDGEWWVLCKHANRTGPYRNLRTALEAARDIWLEPSELHWFCEKVARSEAFDVRNPSRSLP
jgi:hypothetical protein